MLSTLILSVALLQASTAAPAGGAGGETPTSREQGAPQAAAAEVIATYKMMGRDVSATVPVHRPQPGETTHESGGFVYGIRSGTLAYRALPGGWSALKSSYAAVQPQLAQAAPHRVKAVVFTSSDILDAGTDGVLRHRRSEIGDEGVERALQALALAFARAEVAAGGRIRIVPEVSLEEESVRSNVPAGIPFSTSFIEDYFGPRINGSGFEPEDRVYRGPYDSVLFVHPALTNIPFASGLVNGHMVTGVPYYWAFDATQPQTLGNALFRAWELQMAHKAGQSGYAKVGAWANVRPDEAAYVAPGIVETFSPDVWTALTSANPPYATAAANASATWPEVRTSLWTQLPVVRPADLGLERVPMNMGGFEVVRAGQRNILLVDLQFAELAYPALSKDRQLKFLGLVDSGYVSALAFESPELTGSEAQLLGLPVGETAVSSDLIGNSFEPGTAETLPYGGYYSIKSVTDVDQGSVAEVAETGRVRKGWVQLVGTPFDAAKTPILEFSIKASRPEPMQIRVEPLGSSWTGSVTGLFGSARFPGQEPGSGPVATKVLVTPAGTGWQRIYVDVRGGASGGSLPVRAIYLEPAAGSELWEHESSGRATYLLDNVAIAAQPNGSLTSLGDIVVPTQDAKSDVAESRALAAAKLGENATPEEKAAVLALLSDPSQFVRLNAINAFTRVKHSEAVPALMDQSRSITVRHAELATKALAFQDTPEAWQTIEQNLRGPFDHQRAFSALALATRGDKRTAGAISALVTSRSWQTRRAAAEAIGSIPGPEPAIVLMSFLHEVNPAVRLAATRLANNTQNLVVQRLEWSAVNDESDAVRAASYIKLIESPVKGKAAEGYKGVRDDSKVVRLAVLEYLRTRPAEAHRGALRIAVADTHPDVRAAALMGFAALPGEVKAEEVQNVAADQDPRVRAALRELAAAKGLAIG